MKQKDKLGNTLREYYDNQEVPFNAHEWEQASALLDAARSKRKKRIALFILLPLFSALTIILWNISKSTADNKLMATKQSEQKLSPVSPFTQTTESAKTMQKLISKTGTHTPKESSHINSSLASNLTSETQILKVKASLSAEKNSANFESSPAVSKSHYSKQKNSTKENHLVTAPADPINPPAIAKNNNSAKDVTNAMPALKKDTMVKEEQNKTLSDSKDLHLFPGRELAVLPLDVEATELVLLNDNKKEALEMDTTKAGIPENGNAKFQETAISSSVNSSSVSIEIAATDTVLKPSVFNPLPYEGIFYEVGVAGFYGWKGPVHRDARGLSPQLGINYMNRISNHCSLSFGIQYLQVGNLSSSSKTSRVSSYVYGEESSVTVITPSSAQYLLAPLRFNYYADRKNSFGVGINLAYLLNVQAKVTSYDEKPGSNENYKTVKLGGYTQGFSWFDSQLAFCYRRKLGNSFGLQAEIFLGLTDVKQDEFFDFKNKERNSGAKLSLIYYAFKKNNR